MKRVLSVLIAASLLLFFTGCAGGAISSERRLLLTGDAEPYTFTAARYERPIRLEKYIRPGAEGGSLLVTGADGFTALLSCDDLSGVTLVYSEEFAWELRAKFHPPSANVKNIVRIAVVNTETLDEYTRAMKKEGTSNLNGRSVTVFTPEWDVPAGNITKTFHEAVEYLEQGGRVLIIELDGLGYAMLTRSGAAYLTSLRPARTLACFPPNSQVGLAAMLTGKMPGENGVMEKSARSLACDDLFAVAQQMGKACMYIEGKHSVINTSLKPSLSLDDADVFANALAAINEKPVLLFVHFHEIDDVSHDNGPYAKETREKINEIDGYVKALLEAFDGLTIITADHGQHETPEGGSHGEFLPEDMVVPYIAKRVGP